MQSEVYVYRLASPIDNWAGWHLAAAVLGDDGEIGCAVIDDKIGRQEFLGFTTFAMCLARSIGWEGDVRGSELYVAGLPVDGSGGEDSYMVGWKQDNNGCTFIASPVELPHLEDGDDRNWTKGQRVGSANQSVLAEILLRQEAQLMTVPCAPADQEAEQPA